MSSSFDYLDLCRLCLVKDRVTVPIFEAEGDVRQIFLKITACLPVKVSRDDKLPKKICDDCVYKVETFYQFWNTTANAEKQLLQWLCEVGGLEDKQGYEVLDSNVMKQEQGTDSRLDGNVMQVGGHQNNMDMGMMDNMSLITMSTGSEQQFTSVPMDASGTVQAVPGPSTQTHEVAQSQTGVSHIVEEEEESEEDENSDEGCDNEEGLPVKEETEEGQSDQTLEPTQFVSLPCDEAGPSGLQQQKMAEMSEMTMQQTADGDPKTGYIIIISNPNLHRQPRQHQCQYCSQLFPTKPQLALHVRTHTNKSYGCNFCGEPQITAEALSQHLGKHHANLSFSCEVCDKFFSTHRALNLHQRSHNTKRNGEGQKKYGDRYVCLVCDASYKSHAYLKLHTKLRHADPETRQLYKCNECNFVSYYRTNMRKHARSHTGENLAPCNICGKAVNKTYMAIHARIHTGEKPHVCDYCGKAFSVKKYLVVHERTHTGERPFQCKLCNKRFTQESPLAAHIKCHLRKTEVGGNR